MCLERLNTSISLTRETLISGALVTVSRRGSRRALRTVAVALLFSLTVQNRKSVKSEGRSEKSAGGAAHRALGWPCLCQSWLSRDLLPALEKKNNPILVVRVARLWISASAIPVSPPDPVAEVGGIYI